MNTDDPRYDLIRRHLDGDASPEDRAELEKLLREDADFRVAYVRYMNLDLALDSASNSMSTPAVAPSRPSFWHPLRAAAAGLLIGACGSSLVWAVTTPRVSGTSGAPVVFNESFEAPRKAWPSGFPTRTGHWSGDPAEVVGAERSIAPKDGRRMLRMEIAKTELFAHAHYFIDTRNHPAFRGGRPRQIAITASFHATDSEIRDRYVLRAASFAGGPETIEPEWMKKRWNEIGDRALAHAARGITIPPDVDTWQTFTLTIDVPPETETLAFSLWAATMHGRIPMRDVHYLDDVRITVLQETAK